MKSTRSYGKRTNTQSIDGVNITVFKHSIAAYDLIPRQVSYRAFYDNNLWARGSNPNQAIKNLEDGPHSPPGPG